MIVLKTACLLILTAMKSWSVAVSLEMGLISHLFNHFNRMGNVSNKMLVRVIRKLSNLCRMFTKTNVTKTA
ncbi:hypothetical protein EB796_024722 [Bugula neritina]|uniref:Secreted protein n=1 Tax=Bugula neritina TaxID=10212 RepID=A0A7J7ISS7_BUGNE|nr:hypothetical protein EB796_024722 [Bugula neritina]